MNSTTSLLRDADPLARETLPDADARERVRRAVVVAALVPSPSRTLPRRAFFGVAAVATAAVVALIVGLGERSQLQAAVRFEMRLAETQPAPGLLVARVVDSGELIYLHPDSVLTNDDVAQTWVADEAGRFAVGVQFFEAAAQRLRGMTAAHIGRPVAILIDGEVLMAPTLRSAIRDQAVVTGNFTHAQAERIAAGMLIP